MAPAVGASGRGAMIMNAKDDREGEHRPGGFEGVVGAEDGEVPGNVDEDGGDDLIGDLDEDVGEHEGDP